MMVHARNPKHASAEDSSYPVEASKVVTQACISEGYKLSCWSVQCYNVRPEPAELTGALKLAAFPPPPSSLSALLRSSSGIETLRDARMSSACHSAATLGAGGVLGDSGTSGQGEAACDCARACDERRIR